MTRALVGVILLGALVLVGLLLGAEFGDPIRRGCSWLLRPIVPARAVGTTSARRTPARVESVPAAGGAPGAERVRSSPSAPGVVRSGLIDVPASWETDARGVLHPPAPRHASSERINCGGRMVERTMPRKRTRDRQPWDTDRFPVLRPNPYRPERSA